MQEKPSQANATAWLGLLLPWALVAALLALIKSGHAGGLDNGNLGVPLASPAMLGLAKFLDVAGGVAASVLLGLCLVAALYLGGRGRDALLLAVAAVLSEAASLAIKILAHRVRPTYALIAADDPYSFPSGHVAFAVVLAGFAWWVFLRRRSAGAAAVAGLATVWALLVAWSRLSLGLHYATDVLAGVGIGLGALTLTLRFASGPVDRILRAVPWLATPFPK